MSLVVLRSWSDGAPKVRAIAPPDDDDSVYVPDSHGHFVTKELIENDGKDVKKPSKVIENGCSEATDQFQEKKRHFSSQSRSSPDDISISSRADSVSSPGNVKFVMLNNLY